MTDDYGAGFTRELEAMLAKIRRARCKFRLTHLDVALMVDQIAAIENDAEVQHSMEDSLYTLVLAAIANDRCADPVSCAAAALKTKKLSFMRYKA